MKEWCWYDIHALCIPLASGLGNVGKLIGVAEAGVLHQTTRRSRLKVNGVCDVTSSRRVKLWSVKHKKTNEWKKSIALHNTGKESALIEWVFREASSGSPHTLLIVVWRLRPLVLGPQRKRHVFIFGSFSESRIYPLFIFFSTEKPLLFLTICLCTHMLLWHVCRK